MKRVIITGTNGFIGRYVESRLYNEGLYIFSLSRTTECSSDDRKTTIKVDLSDDDSVNKCTNLIDNADVCIHLAADISVPGNQTTIGNNVKSMQSALEIAIASGVKQFIYLSSIPVIGQIKYLPIDENHPVTPQTSYHWSKYLCEKMLEQYGGFFEYTTIIRIPSPIGVGMRTNSFFSIMMEKIGREEDVEIFGNGERIQNYIDVRDIAEAILKSVHTGADGLFLIAGEKSISNLELAETIKKIKNSKSNIRTGIHVDREEANQWIISCEKAKLSFGYSAKNKIEDTIMWMSTGQEK